MKYPFPPGPIDKEEAIKWIVQVVYPFGSTSCRIVDDEKRHYRLATLKMRQKIAYAVKKGELPKGAKINEPAEFFSWAVKQKARKGKESYGEEKGGFVCTGNKLVSTWVKDWSALSRVEGLPMRLRWEHSDHVATLRMQPFSTDNLPEDPTKMSAHYRGLWSFYQEALTKISELELKLSECEAKRRHHAMKSGKR